MTKSKKRSYGYIYKVMNKTDGKIYIGQTAFYIDQYDSMNPDKGYNLKEGGLGGKLSESAKENLSNISKEKWKDPEYREKQINEREGSIRNTLMRSVLIFHSFLHSSLLPHTRFECI